MANLLLPILAPMAETTYKFATLDLSKEGVAAITHLLQEVFPGAMHFNQKVVDWEYNLNPDGKAVGFNAWAGNELAGHYVTIPLLALVDGKKEKGLLSLNTATHANHRGKGLFTQLANKTYEYAHGQGYGFVVGVANANSTPGFTRKLGFQLVGPLRAMYGMGPLPFREGPDVVHYGRVWSKEALEWRLSHPSYTYQVHEGRFNTIFSKQGKMGARYVLGNTLSPIPSGVERTKKIPLKIWIGLDERMNWRSSLYRNIPMRFRPSPLNLIFKDLSGNNRKLDPTRVRFQAIDFDTL